MKHPFPSDVIRAAKLSRFAGVTIADACARFEVKPHAVSRARRELGVDTTPTLAEIVLAALSSLGRESQGTLGDLGALARYIDYMNHDGCTVEDIQRLLAELVADGMLEIQGDRWKLLRPWP